MSCIYCSSSSSVLQAHVFLHVRTDGSVVEAVLKATTGPRWTDRPHSQAVSTTHRGKHLGSVVQERFLTWIQ